jgi:hypothetical protein
MKKEFYRLSYYIKPTRFTNAITLEEYCFKTREERTAFLSDRGKYGKKWWEHLPFVERCFSVGREGEEK